MDVERHVVAVDGETVPLPLKEFDLLEFLLRNAGRVLTRGQLIDRVWGSDYVGDTKTLDVHVKRLRAKIEPDPADRKTTRLNSSHANISYAVSCLKKKNNNLRSARALYPHSH